MVRGGLRQVEAEGAHEAAVVADEPAVGVEPPGSAVAVGDEPDAIAAARELAFLGARARDGITVAREHRTVSADRRHAANAGGVLDAGGPVGHLRIDRRDRVEACGLDRLTTDRPHENACDPGVERAVEHEPLVLAIEAGLAFDLIERRPCQWAAGATALRSLKAE